MAHNITVPDLGDKIDLLLRSDGSPVRTGTQLSNELDISPDYLSRLKSGTRILTEELFGRLCEVFTIKQKEWFDDVDLFGKRLGFSRKQISIITRNPLPGIDFASRIRDKKLISDIFDVICGYWESYYFSVSKIDKKVVSRDLCIVRSVSDDEYIECEVIDGAFIYKGWCFPIKGHLYFILEKEKLYNEIIVYVTNLPDRQPPKLYGIILCISGGVDETITFPSAAKVAFRYIGKDTDSVRKQLGIDSSLDVEEYLKQTIPRYIDPDTEDDDELKRLFTEIANEIPADKIPFALRMTK